jgi:hypothetical protein
MALDRISREEFEGMLDDIQRKAADSAACASVPPSTTLYMNHEGCSIELLIDNKANYYSEWIPGEGADIALLRDRDTKRVVGIHLPMKYTKLIVGDSRSPMYVTFSGSSYADCHGNTKCNP